MFARRGVRRHLPTRLACQRIRATFAVVKVLLLVILLVQAALAADCRVLVDGSGCRTRQLAIQSIWEKLPGVMEVLILPRDKAPAANQRIFVIRSKDASPTKEQLIEALGRRAKFYHVIDVKAQG